MEKTLEKIVALCKGRGFVFPGSEIYGGMANTWDYGPLGVELKNNVKKAWWKRFVQESPYNVGLDSAILVNPNIWVASGHVASFTDPMMDCKECKERFRADKLIEEYLFENKIEGVAVDAMDFNTMKKYIDDTPIDCPTCGKHNFTEIRKFNMMFKTTVGVTEDPKNTVYLRPETAQGIFVNFKNVQRTTRKKMPFGIGQIGKSFRNEITPGKFIFRTLEFEQMELQFFCQPGSDLEWYNYWKNFCMDWIRQLGVAPDNLRFRDHSAEELSFYSKATCDIEFMYPFGWGELWGIADRTDYDLKQHMEHSNEDLNYFDQEKNEKYIPYVIEPSVGVDRMLLMFLCDAYDEEEVGTEEKSDVRTVMRLHPALAPIKAAILPLSKKLSENCDSIYQKLSKHFMCDFDDAGSIGKRYRRQDEIGTPFCITYDFESVEDGSVTVRHRDSMEQERVKIEELVGYVNNRIMF
ncbi:MAG: glycine--tRNA ligase [Defluviitaleaceae bacterium]|nr:glycine--tRNA ligase [Defluviitaleaceae bacterium]